MWRHEPDRSTRTLDGAQEEYAVNQTYLSSAETGVVATLTPGTDNRIRLTLDDVSTELMLDAVTWKHVRLFTYREYDSAALQDLRLSREQFAEIGENILIRLL